MKKIDPGYCFSLPDDRDKLLEEMESQKQSSKRQFWMMTRQQIFMLERVWNSLSLQMKKIFGAAISTT